MNRSIIVRWKVGHHHMSIECSSVDVCLSMEYNFLPVITALILRSKLKLNRVIVESD
jgi:hypothetical protein